MASSISTPHITGISSIIALAFCIFVNALHVYLSKTSERRQTIFGRKLILWSHSSMICITLCPLFIFFTYVHPEYLFNNVFNENLCFCHQYFAFSVIAFAAGLFLFKMNYLVRLNMVLNDSSNSEKKCATAFTLYYGILSIEMVSVITIQYLVCDGNCHNEGDSYYGCFTSFTEWNGWMTTGILFHDMALYYLFCVYYIRRVRSILSPEKDKDVNKQRMIKFGRSRGHGKNRNRNKNKHKMTENDFEDSRPLSLTINSHTQTHTHTHTHTKNKNGATKTGTNNPSSSMLALDMDIGDRSHDTQNESGTARTIATTDANSNVNGCYDRDNNNDIQKRNSVVGIINSINANNNGNGNVMNVSNDMSNNITNNTNDNGGMDNDGDNDNGNHEQRELQLDIEMKKIRKLQLVYSGLMRQFSVTLLAIAVCAVDLICNTIWMDYNMLWLTMVDSCVVVALNLLAFRDSQNLVSQCFFQYICCCMKGDDEAYHSKSFARPTIGQTLFDNTFATNPNANVTYAFDNEEHSYIEFTSEKICDLDGTGNNTNITSTGDAPTLTNTRTNTQTSRNNDNADAHVDNVHINVNVNVNANKANSGAIGNIVMDDENMNVRQRLKSNQVEITSDPISIPPNDNHDH